MIRLLPLCPAHLPWLSYKRPARQLHTILHNSWSAGFTESDCAGFTESDYAGSWMAPFHSFLHWADSDSPWHSREAICDSPSWFRDLISVPTVSSPESIRKLETLFCCKCRPVWSEISTVKQQIALMSLPAYLYNEQQQREQNEWIDERPLLLHFILWPSTAVSKKGGAIHFFILHQWLLKESQFTELMAPAEAGLGAPPPGAHSFWGRTDHPAKPGLFSLLIRPTGDTILVETRLLTLCIHPKPHKYAFRIKR